MKFMRILAVLMAAMLCLTACSAKDENEAPEATAEPAAAATAEPGKSDALTSYESFLVKNLNMPYESWMSENMYPAFAAAFFMDIAYVDAYGITQLSTDCGIPTLYAGELQGDNYGNGMNLSMFFTHPETKEITMISATVYLATGRFEGYTEENVTDMAARMDKMVSDGFLQVYHEIATDAFMAAHAGINQIMSEAATAAQ